MCGLFLSCLFPESLGMLIISKLGGCPGFLKSMQGVLIEFLSHTQGMYEALEQVGKLGNSKSHFHVCGEKICSE